MTTSWSYAGTVGSWIATLDGGTAGSYSERLERTTDVLRRAADGLGGDHRPRHLSMEWAQVDNRGNEIGFHDDDETDVNSWDEVTERLRALRSESIHGVVESMFVDLDVEVELESGLAWLERAGELQLSIGESDEGSRAEISITYSTNVDIWLAENITTRNLGLKDNALAARNLPRLQQTLSRLEAALGASFAVCSSDRYLDQITVQGFRER